jgi:RNA-directed DNA polymerase
MMHEPEKSDPSTVAMKLANNPNGLGAESVEPREGAEGNTNKNRMRPPVSGYLSRSILSMVKQ